MKKKSHFFTELYEAYSAEIEDNRTDSEGKTILQKRLNELRKQFAGYLPMMEDNPEMVTVVLYDAFQFESVNVVQQAICCDPDDAEFPKWQELESTISLAPWAVELVSAALTEGSGDRFLVIAACLEYLRFVDVGNPALAAAEDGKADRPEKDDDGEDLGDLGEDGDDWLSQQGFDSQR